MRKIIIADPDLNYALKLQAKFFQKMQDSIEVEIISENKIIKNFFKTPQTATCLLINETWMPSNIERQNIENIFTLTEQESKEATSISRYSSTEEIYNKIRNAIGTDTRALTKEDCSVILFKSAMGGTGKTVLSLALAEYLSKKYYRVLYVNTQTMQMFQYYMKDQSPISSDVSMTLQFEKNFFEKLKKQIRKENFSYLPPFAMPLYAYNVNTRIYTNFIKNAKESKDFDYIIVDGDDDMDNNTISQIALADKILMISLASEEYKFATNQLLKKISLKENKVIKICNRMSENEPLEDFDEGIYEWHKIDKESIHAFAETNSMQRIAVLIS